MLMFYITRLNGCPATANVSPGNPKPAKGCDIQINTDTHQCYNNLVLRELIRKQYDTNF